MARRAVVIVVAPVVVAIAGWIAFSSARVPRETRRPREPHDAIAKHAPPPETPPPVAPGTPSAFAAIAAAQPAVLPRSLDGTDPDGSLEAGPDGHFLPTRDTLRFFDYFLATIGERSAAEVRSLVSSAIAARLGEPAGSEALAFYDRYVAYRDELARRTAGTRTPREALAITKELRRSTFGPELAARLFGTDETLAEIAIEANEVASDRSLSADERRKRMDALEARMPQEALAARARATLALDLEREERQARARGATESEIGALRTERYGPEAAARLATLDAQRADWNRRVEAYRDARDRLLAGTRDPATLSRAMTALREERFEGPEVLRVRALDRIDGLDLD